MNCRLAALGALLVMMLVLVACGVDDSGSSDGGTVQTIGAKGWLASPTPNLGVLVATDEKAFDEMMKAAIAGDTYGTEELIRQRRIFSTPYNTRVLVIDLDFAKTKVRILDGDYLGQSGWVPFEWVKNSPGPSD